MILGPSARRQRALEGRQILLLEDDFLQARDAVGALENAGASVVGPFANEILALRSLTPDLSLHCAVLDINLEGGIGFSVARELQRRRLPFLFLTCLGPGVVPDEFARVVLLRKPIDLGLLVVATRELTRNPYLH